MATSYHIYANNLTGGPVDYSTPIATVSTLTYAGAGPGASADATYAVRAFDTTTGLEDQNTDCRVRVLTDASGRDITNRPAAPSGLLATARAGGAALVTWQFAANARGGKPTGFHVYLGTPAPNYASPAATVPFDGRGAAYSATLAGLADGTAYQVGVRAYNATAEEPNTAVTSVTGDSTGPLAVEAFVAVPTSTA